MKEGINNGVNDTSDELYRSNDRHDHIVEAMADSFDDMSVTVEWLQKQLAYAEREEKKEMTRNDIGSNDDKRSRQSLEQDNKSAQTNNYKSDVNPMEWSKSKQKELLGISLVHDYFCTMSIEVDDESNHEEHQKHTLSFLVKKCLDLGSLVLSRSGMNEKNSDSKVFTQIQKQYQNLWEHVCYLLQTNMQSCLEELNYPTTSSCDTMVQLISSSITGQDPQSNDKENDNVAIADQQTTKALMLLVHYMNLLQIQQSKFFENNDPSIYQQTQLCLDIWDELCKPLVHRVCFHFITSTTTAMNDRKNLDSNKNGRNENVLDKLPSSLYQYLRDFTPPILTVWLSLHSYILQKSTSAVTTNSSSSVVISHFQKRIVQLIMHIYQHFRLFAATTPHNNHVSNDQGQPIKCMTAHSLARTLEQTLHFDKFLLQEIIYIATNQQSVFTSTGGVTNAILNKYPSILTWWINVENKNALYATKLVLQRQHDGEQNQDAPLLSPVVELFISTWKSLKQKSSLLSSSNIRRRFFTQVALPVCQTLIDDLHEEASSLKQSLLPKKRGSLLPCDKHLFENIQGWLNVITSTHVASLTILLDNNNNDQYFEFQHELKPIGTSLENLRDAMLEDLCNLIVETLLVERAKLASYQIKCAHMLTQHKDEENINDNSDESVKSVMLQLSPDLFETAHVLEIVINCCQSFYNRKVRPVSFASVSSTDDSGSKKDDWARKVLQFAPNKLWMNVGKNVQEKFLEIALDVHDMIPKLKGTGAKQFLFDVQYMATHVLPPTPYVRTTLQQQLWSRVLEIATFMAISDAEMTSLFQTWQSLFYDPSKNEEMSGGEETSTGKQDNSSLDIHFTDEALICQAESMLRAKGYKHMKLADAVCIMNKRLYDYNK